MKLSIACVVALAQLFILITRLHSSVLIKTCGKGRREYSASNTLHNGRWKEYSFKLHICCEGDWCRDGQELKPTTTTEQAVHEEEVAEEELKKNLFAEPTEHHDPMPDNLHGADLPFHFTEMTPKYYFGFSFGSAANMSQVKFVEMQKWHFTRKFYFTLMPFG
uniref:Secreted protein n=1 Tax=Globodera pallida TaxID=36090 RepID=A0A183BWH4_GLOPA